MATRTTGTRTPKQPDNHKKVPVPGKNKPIRRWVAKARNGTRRGRRLKAAAGTWWKSHTGEYKCIYCDTWQRNRNHAAHDKTCGYLARQELNKRKKRDKDTADAVDKGVPPKRKPSKTKAAKTAAQTTTTTQVNVPVQQGGGETVASTDSNGGGWGTGRRRRGGTKTAPSNGSSNGGSGGPKLTPEAANVVKAYEAYCQAELKTAGDLRRHLEGGDAMFSAMAQMTESFAAETLLQRVKHPVIVQPIQAAADAIAGMSHFFTDSYIAFERVFENALNHARQDGPKPDVNDPIFTEAD